MPTPADYWRHDDDHAWGAPGQRASHGGVVVVMADRGPNAWDESALAAALDGLGLTAVWPRRPGGWWTDRLTPEESGPSVLAALLSETAPAARRHFGESAPLALLGVGPGGHGALRLAYQRAREFPVVAAWRPAIDCHALLSGRIARPKGIPEAAVRDLAARYEDAERCRQDSAVLHIHPLGWPRCQWFGCPPADPWWEGCDRLRMKLTSLGVPFEADLETPYADDDPAALDRIARWIDARFADEARRVT